MQKTWQFLWFFLVIVNSTMFISCSKEESANAAPQVVWYAPTENNTFQAGDTVLFRVNVIDGELITGVSITLKNDQNVPELSKDFPVYRKEAYLEFGFPLKDLSLDGRHFFELSVQNSTSVTTMYRYVWIQSAPLKLEKVFVLSSKLNSTQIFSLDSTSLIPVNTVNGDIKLSGFDQKNYQLITMGDKSGNLNAFDSTGQNLLWEFVAPNIPDIQYFRGMVIDNEGTTISTQDSRIITFSSEGVKGFDEALPSNIEPGLLFRREGELYYSYQDLNNNSDRFKFMYYPSGLEKGGTALNTDERIIGFHDLGGNELFVFINDKNDSYLKRFNTSSMFFNLSIKTINQQFGVILSIDPNTIIYNQGGSLYKYHISQNLSTLLKSNYSPDVIRYDKSTLTIWAAKGNELTIISLDGTVLNQLVLSENITSFELVFNR